MTLVERFIEISRWPLSRKALLWGGAFLLPMHLLTWWVLRTGNSRLDLVDVRLLDRVLATGVGIVLWGALQTLPYVLGRWREGSAVFWILAGLNLAAYCTFIVALTYLFGSVTSPSVAFVPVVALFIMVFYDLRLGWFALGWMLLCLVAVGVLESYGVLPYAPLTLERSIDTLASSTAFAITYSVLFLAFLVGPAFCAAVVAARQLQESRLLRAQALIRRYVPSQVADAVLSGREAAADGHERRKLTIFFSDLVGFTDIAEELEPEDLSKVLNEYFSAMTTIAQKHGGTVDELIGDSILIFFGAPHATDDRDHALRAVRMASEMQQAVQELNEKWRRAGITEALRARMGINTGVVTVGNFGSPERMKYAVLGKHVNLAARLQSHCEPGKVLIGHATWLLVQDQVPCRPLGELQLKGIAKPVGAYEVAAP